MPETITRQLSPLEEGLYKKSLEKNPGLTPEDFLELRREALKTSSPGVKKFFEKNGIISVKKPELEFSNS